MSILPLDIHITILTFLPPSRRRFVDDTSIQTLVHYSRANSLLREASHFPAVWEPLYQARYRHHNPSPEALRKARYAGNWRLIYCERRRIDKNALELLRDITLLRTDRNDKAMILSKMGLDVWDVLDIERSFVPSIRSPPVPESPYALTRHFWAKRMLEIIARREAIDVWATLLPDADAETDKRASFEQTMLGLSSFLGHSMHDASGPPQNQRHVADDQSADDTAIGQYGSGDLPFTMFQNYAKLYANLWELKTLGLPTADQTFLNVANNFPHAYLTTNRRTLPIGLVHVFVSLARRIGLDAFPVNFPQKVLCYVRSPKEGDGPYHVDPYVAGSSDCVVQMQDLLRHFSNLIQGFPQTILPRYLNPAEPPLMLLRAANNIRRSCWHNRPSFDAAQCYEYLEVIIHLLFYDNIDILAQEMDSIEFRPLDCATFLMDKLAPLLSPRARTILEIHCERTQENEVSEAAMVQRREGSQPVRYFVGLPFKHREYGYVACIVRWDATCKADETWIRTMGVDSLGRGRHQPFYKSLVLDQEATQRYVAEDNVDPVPLSEIYIEQFFEKHASMAQYFQSVEIQDTPEIVKRWRLVLSPDSKANYPEDDAIASAWVKEAVLP